MLYREIIAVCSQIHTKHINTLCGQKVEWVNVEPGGTYRGADKSLARPGRKQSRKHVRDARHFDNIETRAVIKFLLGKASKEIHAILTETLKCFLPGRAKDLSALLYNDHWALKGVFFRNPKSLIDFNMTFCMVWWLYFLMDLLYVG